MEHNQLEKLMLMLLNTLLTFYLSLAIKYIDLKELELYILEILIQRFSLNLYFMEVVKKMVFVQVL